MSGTNNSLEKSKLAMEAESNIERGVKYVTHMAVLKHTGDTQCLMFTITNKPIRY